MILRYNTKDAGVACMLIGLKAKPVLCPGLDTIYDGGAAGEGEK